MTLDAEAARAMYIAISDVCDILADAYANISQVVAEAQLDDTFDIDSYLMDVRGAESDLRSVLDEFFKAVS